LLTKNGFKIVDEMEYSDVNLHHLFLNQTQSFFNQ